MGRMLAQLRTTLSNRSLQNKNPKTPLQVLKLIYFAHAWILVFRQRPLFRQTVEAWKYGPVVPDVYHALKQHGRRTIPGPIPIIKPYEGVSDEIDIVEWVAEKYDGFSGEELSHMTHWPDSPWFVARVEGGLGATISNKLTEAYYMRLAKRLGIENGFPVV